MAISAGNEHDSLYFTDVADKIELKGVIGRPKRRPAEINADPAYDRYRIYKVLPEEERNKSQYPSK